MKGSCQSNADMLYFTGVPVPDPFYAFTLRGKNCALIGALEFDRLSKGGALDEIFDLTSLSRKFFPDRRTDDTAVLSKILKKGASAGFSFRRIFPLSNLKNFAAKGSTWLFPNRRFSRNAT